MRRAIVTFVILLSMAHAALAWDPVPEKLALSISGGMNLPQGDLSEGTKNGSALGAGLVYCLNSRLSIGGEFVMNHYDAEDDLQAVYGSDASADLDIYQYTGFLRMTAVSSTRHHLYMKGLLGAYTGKVSVRVGSYELEDSDTELGFGVGGGLQINGSRGSSLYLESLYHHVAAEDGGADFVTATVGVLFFLK